MAAGDGVMTSPETVNSKLMSPVMPKSFKERVVMINNGLVYQQTVRNNNE